VTSTRYRLAALIGVVIALGAEVAHGKECLGVGGPCG
jgi:hypothetical protein